MIPRVVEVSIKKKDAKIYLLIDIVKGRQTTFSLFLLAFTDLELFTVLSWNTEL